MGSISKVVSRRRLHEPDPARAWWRSRTPAERLAHLQELDQQNANRLVSALEDFGFGSLGFTPADFLEEGVVVQLGYPPKRIDILTQVDGVQFDPWWERRVEAWVVSSAGSETRIR